jgi:hypothetical protein
MINNRFPSLLSPSVRPLHFRDQRAEGRPAISPRGRSLSRSFVSSLGPVGGGYFRHLVQMRRSPIGAGELGVVCVVLDRYIMAVVAIGSWDDVCLDVCARVCVCMCVRKKQDRQSRAGIIVVLRTWSALLLEWASRGPKRSLPCLYIRFVGIVKELFAMSPTGAQQKKK